MLRTLLLISCIVAMSFAFHSFTEDQMIKFNFDTNEEQPFGVFLKGQLDPKNNENNKIQAFLKLANKYIPILESLQGMKQGLKWERYWNIRFAGVNLLVHGYFQLYIGWAVNPGTYTGDRFDVQYIPYVWGATYGVTNGTTFLANGTAGAGVRYVFAYAPISLQLFRSGKVCFQGSYVVEPVHSRGLIAGTLLGCWDEIIDEVLDGHFTPVWKCEGTPGFNVTVLDVNWTEYMGGDFLPQNCIDL